MIDPDRQIPSNTAESVNLHWFDALVRHQVYVLRLAGSVREDVTKLLNNTEKEIARKIESALAGDTKMSPARMRRAELLIKQLRSIRTRAWDKVDKVLTNSMTDLTLEEVKQVRRILDTVVPVELDTVLPSARTLRALVTSQPFEGRTLSSWAKNIRQADLDRIAGQVRVGVVQGLGAKDIARKIIGTARLKGRDGVTQIIRRNAEAIVRTASNFYSNAARSEFFADNSDIFSKEVFVATLDSRTTLICMKNDGKRFSIGEGPIPPLHFNCRSLRVAEISGEVLGERPAKPFTQKMLLKEFAKENQLGKVTKRGDLPRGFKTKFDDFAGRRVRELTGRIPAKVTYSEWLSRQSAEFQNEVLGKTRARLFRSGKVTLDKFVDRRGNTIRLDQLADKHAAAFKSIGLDPDNY